jgi:hypothetical protein
MDSDEMIFCSDVCLTGLFSDILSSSKWMIMNSYSGHYIKTDHNLFLPHPSQFISLHHPVIQQYLTRSFF